MKTKEALVEALGKFITKGSGIKSADYNGDREAYLTDSKRILQHGWDAREMLKWIANNDKIGLEEMLDGLKEGCRLHVRGGKLEYTVGQHFPTEYRAEACCVLSQIVWMHLRWHNTPPDCTSDDVRFAARQTFGAGIAKRWLDGAEVL
jgi:hypothetical protein